MFIESLTPDQLVSFAKLVALCAFFGGLVGSLAVALFSGLLNAVADGVGRSTRTSTDRVADLRRDRRLHLIAALTARRELRKLRHG